MPVILKNNASSTLATAITASDTAIVVADGSQFPALSAGEYFYATLVSPAGTTEIIKVTARVSNSLTVVRAQDGSSAASFQVGARVDMRVNAATVNDLVDEHDQAAEISIADAGGYYTGTNVEAALQEAATGLYYRQGASGSVARTVQGRLRDSISVKDFGATGDGVANDLTEIQAAVDSGVTAVSIPPGTYDLGGGTLTLPAGSSILLDGGVLTNGTIACDGNFFFGARGLSESITLTGIIANEDGVFFDWFTCEKATRASYDTFINGNNATFGAAPAISSKNRIILDMLMANAHHVQFGTGIYPFDAVISIAAGRNFYLKGLSRARTLIWCPTSSFIQYTAGGATYPYFRDLRIEAYAHVLRTQAWSVNAIHGLEMTDCHLVSYTDHTFINDNSTSGGTGCPIYGSLIKRCSVYAGADKGCFYNWGSGSNIYDNIVDTHYYFNTFSPVPKGIMRSIFWNSNVRRLCHCNIAYAGFKYVAYYDPPVNTLFTFVAENNVFETNSNSFDHIVYSVNAGGSNIYLNTKDNFYIGTPKGTAPNGVTGLHYVFASMGNVYLEYTDSPTPIYALFLRNRSPLYVSSITPKLDSASTKFRLSYAEPYSSFTSGVAGESDLYTPSSGLATLLGMDSLYSTYSADISYIQTTRSMRAVKSGSIAGGYGSTAARPTDELYVGYIYFDTTLGKPVWYNGSGWVDATGASV